MKQVCINDDNTLTVENKWIYPACDYAFCGPVEANGVQIIYQEGQSTLYCLQCSEKPLYTEDMIKRIDLLKGKLPHAIETDYRKLELVPLDIG